MSRGIWAVIGAIAGFFIGGYVAAVLWIAQSSPTFGEEVYVVLGLMIGVPIGGAIAWDLAGRRKAKAKVK
jgi:hypothetical protein